MRERCLKRLAGDTGKLRVILVLFADAMPDFDAVALAARIGAHGVMFDTMGKRAGSLPEHMSFMGLADRIAAAKAEGLIVGLAGSLQARHVPSLLALAARSARLSRRALPWRRPRHAARSRPARRRSGP